MNFAAWIFLFGIVAVAGPIFAHFLAKPRYRRVPFTMLQFLKNSQIESHSRRHLRDLFILLLRCLIIIVIAFLFAQPFIFWRTKPKENNNIHYLGLDDSASMAYSDSGESYFKKMKDSAIEYIISSKPDDIFNICSLVSGQWSYGLDKQQALAQVQSLKIKTKRADIGAFISGLNNSNENAKQDDKLFAYLISDFTGNILQQSLNIQEPAFIDEISFKLISSSKPINNISIVGAEIEDFKNSTISINVTINSNCPVKQNRKLYALINNDKVASSEIVLNPSQSKTVPLVIEESSMRDYSSSIPIELLLTPHDNLREDDNYYMAIEVPKQNISNILLAETQEDEMFLFEVAVNTISESQTINKYNIKRLPADKIKSSDLNWANIVVYPKIPDSLNNINKALPGYINSGGRTIFFMDDKPVSQIAKKLSQDRILPALPVNCIKEKSYLELRPGSQQVPALNNNAIKALANYRIDRLAFKGYWNCEPVPQASCMWQYQNNIGFIYYLKHGNGSSILVNSSIDNSLGSLMKSNASVAFCQCLLGEQDSIINSNFSSEERIVLSIDNDKLDKIQHNQVTIENCNGQKQIIPLNNSFITIPESEGTGWIKTTKEPVIYAGVNLPAGETNMTLPSEYEIQNAISRLFQKGTKERIASAEGFKMKKEISLWKYFAWILIILLLVESATANRMKR